MKKDMSGVKIFTFNPFGENTLVLWQEGREKDGVIVDPGCMVPAELEELKAFVAAEGISPRAILLTHGHFDHIYGVPALAKEYGIPVYMHPDDVVMVENNDRISRLYQLPDAPKGFPFTPVADDEEIVFAGEADTPSGAPALTFKVIATPGHTPGGVCYYSEARKLLLSGDTLFAGAIGRTDHPWGDYDKLIVSIMEKLMDLPGDVDVIPGHGPVTTIADERTSNPFLQPFNEPDEEMPEEGIPISF